MTQKQVLFFFSDNLLKWSCMAKPATLLHNAVIEHNYQLEEILLLETEFNILKCILGLLSIL